MRDPYLVPRPRMFPPSTTCVLTTRNWGRSTPVHSHRANYDSNGNGVTDITASHFHRIVGGVVKPSPVDSHEHQLTNLPGGWGIA